MLPVLLCQAGTHSPRVSKHPEDTACGCHEAFLCVLQASEVAGVCCVLQSVGDPLSLSLGLDILEEILAAGDRAKYAKRMAREGALAAVVRAWSPVACHVLLYCLLSAGENIHGPSQHCVKLSTRVTRSNSAEKIFDTLPSVT